MVPRTILRQLARLRRRERILQLAWGASRWLALVLAALAAACLTDYLIDRRQDTPWSVRVGLLFFQAVLWSVAGLVFLLWPLARRLTDSRLALWVEEKEPRLGHRLISAVQLNRPGAATEGMSPELIALVTREAEERARAIPFTRVADHRRLRWAFALAIPFIAAAGLALALWPATVQALLARQILADREIPRSVNLESTEADLVWPAGEEVVLHFRATGDSLTPEQKGEVRVQAEGLPGERYPLAFESMTAPGEAVFAARVPPSAADFIYHAWLEDGRTRRPSRVHFEAQPVIVEQRAWVQLPAYVGLRPDGKPYEQEQVHGDVAALPSSKVRVLVKAQKPVARAFVEVLGPATPPGALPNPDAPAEKVLRQVELTVPEGGDHAEGTFGLQGGESAYRVVVRDRYGFENAAPPRRSIRILAEDVPQVALLPEQFPGLEEAPSEDFEAEGVPVPLGAGIRVAYWCSAPYGLGRAEQRRTPRLRYRINDGPWGHLDLTEAKASPEQGPFDPRRGAFAHSAFTDQVEFYAVPSADPVQSPGRTEGGGRFDFRTRAPSDPVLKGLKVGDRIEYYVEVFDSNPSNLTPGRSETRVKNVVSVPELETWVRQTLQEESRIRRLEIQQRRIFARATPEDEEEERTTSALAEGPAEKPAGPPEAAPGAHPAQAPFVRDWQLIGPFPSPNRRGHQLPFPPELEKVDLAREYDGLKGKVHWQPFNSPADLIDLAGYFHHQDSAVAYAACWVHTREPKQALLSVGSDDGIKVWINRRLDIDAPGPRAAFPGQNRMGVSLSPGWNEVLVKVDNDYNTWGFYFQLLEPAGNRPLEGVELRTTPPDDNAALFVQSWQLMGPFANPNDGGLETAYPPETEPVDLKKEYDGLKGKVRWQLHPGGSDKIDLEKALAHGDAGVAYAVCWVRSLRPQKALMATGSDDGIKVWLNRQPVLTRHVHREAVPGDDRETVELRPGWNEFLVKVDNKFGSWAFYLQLLDPVAARPLPGLVFQTTPPGEGGRCLRDWQLIGPFPAPDPHHGLSAFHPPEHEPFDPGKDYRGRKGNVRWRQHHAEDDYVDLAQFFDREPGVAYAACWVRSDQAKPALLSIGSNDGVKVWVNRREVLNHEIGRTALPGQDTARADLAAGWNELLVKVDNIGGGWGLYLELKDPATGGPLQGVEVRATPPEGVVSKPAAAPPRFLRDWQLIGPFPALDPRHGLQSIYPPEFEKFEAGKEYNGLKDKVRWQLHHADRDYVDLARFYNHRQAGVAYAVCWVRSEAARPVLLSIGSNDGVAVWIERKKVHTHEVGRSASPGQDRARGELKAGWNELLVKVDNNANDWGFYLELRDPATNRPLEGVEFRTSPP